MFKHSYKLLAKAVDGIWLGGPLHPRREGSNTLCWALESGPEDVGTTRLAGSEGWRRSQGNWGGLERVGWNGDAKVGSPTIVGDADPPESVRGVSPPSKEDFPIGQDFAPCAVKVHVAPSVDQGCDRQEIVNESGEAMSQPRCYYGEVAKE